MFRSLTSDFRTDRNSVESQESQHRERERKTRQDKTRQDAPRHEENVRRRCGSGKSKCRFTEVRSRSHLKGAVKKRTNVLRRFGDENFIS